MNAKGFFYVSAGILFLVIAYSVGARRVDAQSSGDFAGICVSPDRGTMAIRSNGDVYARNAVPVCTGPGSFGWFNGTAQECSADWTYMGNVLGGPVPVDAKTMTDVKGTYRK